MSSIFSYTRTIGTGTLMIALMIVIMTGCARQPTLNASKDLISVTVLPAGPPNWVYTVQSSHMENLTVIEFVSPALEGVEVLALPEEIRISTEHTSKGIRVSLEGTIFGDRATQFRRLRLILTSDTPKQNGDIKIRVTDFRGKTTMVGPIAGPVS
ncbi:MAG TPA: hypothetical protein DIT99_26285 [Candidatus Latescibacteria bacterium]|nr:hypothetical protein [Candidatus Latescibacterota bacterium]